MASLAAVRHAGRTPFPEAFPAPAPLPSRSAAEHIDPDERPVSWKRVVPNFFEDQKTVLLFPYHLAQGKHVWPTLAVVGITTGLVVLDPYDTPYFRKTSRFEGYNETFNVLITERVALGFPVLFYLASLVRHDTYGQHTFLLAGEAVADEALLLGVMRTVDGRLHPRDIAPNGDFRNTWFKAKGSLINRGGFPSGHTALMFTVATIFSDRYRNHPWVRWVAYSLATATALARISQSAHFPSDVFFGAVVGYSLAHYVVLRQP